MGEFDCIAIFEEENRFRPKIIIAENKWRSSKAEIGDINEFFGKIRTLLNSAIDIECIIFISYNGFTEDAKKRALEISKTDSVYFILIDGDEIEKCIFGHTTFENILIDKINQITSKLV